MDNLKNFFSFLMKKPKVVNSKSWLKAIFLRVTKQAYKISEAQIQSENIRTY